MLYQGGTNLVHFADFGPWVVDVGKNHTWSTEDAIFEIYTVEDGDVVLDLALVTYSYVWADDRVLADVAVGTDFRTF